MEKTQDTSVRVVMTAIFGNFVITIAKFIGWIVSSSPSMLAEAIHSMADTANQGLLFIGIHQGRKGPSARFPWGTGQARYVWNLVSAMGIFFVGFGVTSYHGDSSLFHHDFEANKGGSWMVIGILSLSFILDGYALLLAVKEVNKKRSKTKLSFFQFIKQSDDPTTIGVVLEDSVAVFGVFVAAVSIFLSNLFKSPLPDAIGSLIIGFLLGMMAIILAILNGRLLIGKSIRSSKSSDIRQFLESYEAIEKVVEMKTVVLGSGQIHLAAEVEFHGELLLDRKLISRDAEKIRQGADPAPILVDTAERMVRIVGSRINDLEKDLSAKFPDIKTIELEVH